MKITRTRATVAVLAVGTAVALSACSTTSTQSGNAADKSASNAQLKTYQATQPIPHANWSQYRQTVIDVENAEINGVATTTFFYNMGSNTPIKSCPSIGFPVASTSELTNPQVAESHGQYGDGTVTVGQQEPNGVFTGSSTGTHVVCVQANGTKRIDYWEGFVETEGGSAHYDQATNQIVDDGTSTVVSKSHP